ncbi:signal peptidase II [Spiroplasma alleghenense]|uniref:Lipoprotein signal peptidase n=1 Tax=Spiroplasma alleghenense TaxID=216931 RepID=A0A345Z3V7_9MOLU|nr:signal peptidase II [Spiroplasma alleghenense]AXK51286.1 lipoprotein signal peptidase [Spiroplasma alleghenense]
MAFQNFKNFLKKYNYEWKFKLIVCLPIFIVLVVIDWITKGIVVAKMAYNSEKPLIPGFLRLHYIINPGAAYGMNANNVGLAITIATLATLLFSLVFIFVNSRYWLIGITILLSGSWGNLLARAWAPEIPGYGIKGGVVDFLVWDFKFLGSDGYIFNIADLWVNIAIVYLIVVAFPMTVYLFIKESRENRRYEQELANSNGELDSKTENINTKTTKTTKKSKIKED